MAKRSTMTEIDTQRTLLALDTATTGCSACVWRAGDALAVLDTPMARGQAEHLMPLIDQVLNAAGVQPPDLDAIAVTVGPGAFTGLRIALAAARGFALALDVPCVGVSTLEAVAFGVDVDERAHRRVLAVVDSKRDDVFAQLFSTALEPLSEPVAAGADELAGLLEPGESIVVVGDGAERALAWLKAKGVDARASRARALPDPVVVARLAARALAQGRMLSAEPLYLRPPDAKLPAAEGRLRV